MSKFYELGDPFGPISRPMRKFRALNTGVKRPPRKGEWYLSGAIIQAYRAPNDLSTEFYIAEIVEVEIKTETTTTIVKRNADKS